ncbi:MAG: hypothetical protein KGJ57_07870 [Sphingomonadales bacterium]|nr:hypothetical protein [Sphingomonadales bacterium]MDE2169330.1 hypothetical protein [Sphingomonadales bacterium]
MSKAEEELAALKARRDMDRLTLIDRVNEARELAKPKVLAARAKADVEIRARSAAAQALEIANDHRGVVIGTVSVLALWAMRSHLGSKIAQKLGPVAAQAGDTLGRAALSKAPGLIAPFMPAWLSPFVAPVLRHVIARKPSADPE